jgi:hypothetical protein
MQGGSIMTFDTDPGELTEAELDLVSGGKKKEAKALAEAMELEKDASNSGFPGLVFGKGAGGASGLT